ncbi:MAG: hypothetical protein IT235_07715 [Bacteroidia bacterium]|nr:hypothetical protein [Bacteroidia bacterium]
MLYFLASCSCEKSPLAEYGESFEQLMRTDSGLFRGMDLGLTKEQIKTIEPNGLKEEDNNDGVNYLFYELNLDSVTTYTLAYYLPNNRLNSIEADIYLLNEPEAADLFAVFKKYFEKKYGQALVDGDFYFWTAIGRMGKTRIALADESPTYKRGKLTLVIHDEQD